jgi:hypothetical protein
MGSGPDMQCRSATSASSAPSVPRSLITIQPLAVSVGSHLDAPYRGESRHNGSLGMNCSPDSSFCQAFLGQLVVPANLGIRMQED